MLIIQAGSATAVKKFDRNMQELKALLAFHTKVSQHPLPNPATGDYHDADILEPVQNLFQNLSKSLTNRFQTIKLKP